VITELNPLVRAFCLVGSERTAVDSIVKLTGRSKADARTLVRLVRSEVTP